MKIYKRVILPALAMATFTFSAAMAQEWELNGVNPPANNEILGTLNNNPLIIETSGTEKARFATDGKLGIGTTTPARAVELFRNGAPQLSLSDFNATWQLWGGIDLVIRRGATNWLQFDGTANGVRVGPGSQLFVSSTGANGNVGVGTTSPAEKLSVAGSLTPAVNCSYDIGNSTYRWGVIYAFNGTIQTSDARLKENIEDITYGVDAVMKLHAVSYTWKEDPGYGRKLGLLAQEVGAVIPEVVKGDASSLGIFYSDLIPVLVKAIQEQRGTAIDNTTKQTAARTTSETLDERLARLEAAANARGLSGVESPELGSNGVKLDQNDPNPTDGITTISYTIPSSVAKAELVISEIASGKEISRGVIDGRGAGETTVSMAGFGSGTYVYTIIVDGKVAASRKMVVAK